MADFADEWRSFADDTFYCHHRPTSPLLRWPTNAKRLLDKIVCGDRLWLFVGCFQDVRRKNGTYNLAQVFRVREIGPNETDDDDLYPSSLFPREIRAEPGAWVMLDPFIPVARVADGVWHDEGVPMGTLRRGPRRLSNAAVRALQALIGAAAVDRLAACGDCDQSEVSRAEQAVATDRRNV